MKGRQSGRVGEDWRRLEGAPEGPRNLGSQRAGRSEETWEGRRTVSDAGRGPSMTRPDEIGRGSTKLEEVGVGSWSFYVGHFHLMKNW